MPIFMSRMGSRISHALIMGKFMSSDYKYKRVLLKISGEALMGSQAYGIDTDTVKRCGYARTISYSDANGLRALY